MNFINFPLILEWSCWFKLSSSCSSPKSSHYRLYERYKNLTSHLLQVIKMYFYSWTFTAIHKHFTFSCIFSYITWALSARVKIYADTPFFKTKEKFKDLCVRSKKCLLLLFYIYLSIKTIGKIIISLSIFLKMNFVCFTKIN